MSLILQAVSVVKHVAILDAPLGDILLPVIPI